LEVKITVTLFTLLSGVRDTDVTCGAESGLDSLRSKVILGATSAPSAVGKLTIHGEYRPAYFWISTEESSFVALTLSSGRSGSVPSVPIAYCSGQRTVVVVPALVALVVTVARVVVVVAPVAEEVVVGAAEVDAAVPAGVDDAAVVVPSVAAVVAATVVVAER